jgi:hypothetical protein
MIDQAVAEVEPMVGTAPACRALGASRASLYRRRTPPGPRGIRHVADDETTALCPFQSLIFFMRGGLP